jgi:hypothetical protein
VRTFARYAKQDRDYHYYYLFPHAATVYKKQPETFVGKRVAQQPHIYHTGGAAYCGNTGVFILFADAVVCFAKFRKVSQRRHKGTRRFNRHEFHKFSLNYW